MQTKQLVAAVTNPLHYAYLRQAHSFAAIGSRHGLLQEYSAALGFDAELVLYDVPNTIETLVTAHEQANQTASCAYVAWKPSPLAVPFAGNSYELAHPFEQKAFIRTELASDLFPAFTTVLSSAVSGLSFQKLAAQLHAERLVVQIDFSTGGKGTFFIDDESSLKAALPKLEDSGQTIVVSKRIAGTSRGVQCFVGKTGTYSTEWWHRDLVGIKGVCNMAEPSTTRYAGAVLENIPAEYTQQVQAMVQMVGAQLMRRGYQGIFGMDIVVDETAGRIYLIEINPRVTAVSHVYATAMHAVGYDTDFLTAQFAAVLDISTTLKSESQFKVKRLLPAEYYYLKFQNQAAGPIYLSESCKLGVYDTAGEYQRFGFGIDALHTADEIVVIPEARAGVARKPGERTFSIIGMGNPVAGDSLLPALAERILGLSQKFFAQ